jgi:hypothetical protein
MNSIVYMYTMKVNDFFRRPFIHRVEPHYFLCGSLFYAFVTRYETKRNLTDAMRDLVQNNRQLVTIVDTLYTTLTAYVNTNQ